MKTVNALTSTSRRQAIAIGARRLRRFSIRFKSSLGQKNIAGRSPLKRPEGRAPLSLVACFLFFLTLSLHSFPPAPHHLIFGIVRDDMGDPISTTNAQIILETSAGVQIKGSLIPDLEPGVNYHLSVPMDSGVTRDAYKPTALSPTVPFKIRVRIGQTSFLPLEMVGDFSQLGLPGKRTRINLTLGEDSDGDGLPDAWERALIAMLGGNRTLADIRPQDDLDGDGFSNIDEYRAGTFAFDNSDGFSVSLLNLRTNGAVVVEFLAIRGRTYSIHGSTNLQQWSQVPFKVLPEVVPAPVLMNYHANEMRKLQVEVIPETGQPVQRFFKMMLE